MSLFLMDCVWLMASLKKKLGKLFSGDFEDYLDTKVAKWDGLELSENKLILNKKGIMLADEIASDLFID